MSAPEPKPRVYFRNGRWYVYRLDGVGGECGAKDTLVEAFKLALWMCWRKIDPIKAEMMP